MIFDRADDKTCHDFPWVQQVFDSQLRCPNAMPDVNAVGKECKDVRKRWERQGTRPRMSSG